MNTNRGKGDGDVIRFVVLVVIVALLGVWAFSVWQLHQDNQALAREWQDCPHPYITDEFGAYCPETHNVPERGPTWKAAQQ